MKLKRLGSIFLAAAMMTAALTGCGGGSSKDSSGGDSASGGKSTVTLWATGSDNVRSIFEKLTEDFNTNSEYKDQYQVELQFMLSGTGAQGLADMVAAAGKAGQTNTDYDIVDWSGDDLAKIMSKIGEESFVKLDKSRSRTLHLLRRRARSRRITLSRTAAPPLSLPTTPRRFRPRPRPWTSWLSG